MQEEKIGKKGNQQLKHHVIYFMEKGGSKGNITYEISMRGAFEGEQTQKQQQKKQEEKGGGKEKSRN